MRWDTVTTADGDMRCYVAVPAESGPHPAVIVIQHAGGVDQFVQGMTDRIAAAGYAGIAPDLYHREDPASSDDPMTRMGRLRDVQILVDVDAAIAHARTLGEVRPGPLGVTGFCMGGRVAYLVAAARDDIAASVVFYGGNINRAWGDGPSPFERSSGIAAPVLGLFGEDDGNPSPADVAALDEELTKRGKRYEFHSYAGAGHAFMNEGRPSYRADAAADAWRRCIAWFDAHLRA
jgi:carboxymethylenebutenolidase